MKRSHRFLTSILFLGAYLLSACSGAVMPQQDDSSQGPGGAKFTEVVFTGAVESMGGVQWTISGQSVGVDGSTAVDPSVKVGDIVRVEARVFQDGAVLALKVESSLPDDTANSNDSNSNDASSANSNDSTNANGNDNANSNDDNSNSAPSGTAQEFSGVVEAITADSITISGVTYSLAAFTEFKDIIAVGDQVKIHVIVNADGSLTIREIERTTGSLIGNDNDDDGNSNVNSNDDNSNDDGSNANSNDDDSNDDNSNGDDDGNDNDSNDND